MARRRIPPIRARVADAKAYEGIIRKQVVNPMMGTMWRGLSQATTAFAAYKLLHAGMERDEDMPERSMRVRMDALDKWHRHKFIHQFRTALEVDIRPYLQRGPVDEYMEGVIRGNVKLLKSIGPEAHEGMAGRLKQHLHKHPFDRKAVFDMMRQEYGKTVSRAKLIAHDQTGKTVGKLNEYRQTQCGIDSYTWLSSRDARVRPTHVDNDGKVFKWKEPPLETGHPKQDVRCRCDAIPVIPELVARGATTQ